MARRAASRTAKWPECQMARRAARLTTKWPECQMARRVARQTTKWPECQMARRAARLTAKWPECQMASRTAKWPECQMARRPDRTGGQMGQPYGRTDAQMDRPTLPHLCPPHPLTLLPDSRGLASQSTLSIFGPHPPPSPISETALPRFKGVRHVS